jgi:hypothetical protein
MMQGGTQRARRTTIALLCLFGAILPLAWADERSAEYEIKAAFLCKFGNYVEWPAGSAAATDGQFGIGVVASESVAEELARTARGQTVKGRSIAVHRVGRGESVDGLSIVFIARSDAGRMAEILAAAKGRPILTVTESERGPASGGIVNFIVVDDKVKFDIALPQAEANGLKISARLLAVAHAVVGKDS